MANEDVLRLRATFVSDQALANIRNMGREIGLMQTKAGAGAKAASKEFQALLGSLQQVGGAITATSSAFGSFGLGAAGAAGAAAGLVLSLNRVANQVVQLKYASKEIGMSERDLRAWMETAEKAGQAPEAMLGSLKSFSRTMNEFKYNMGSGFDDIIARGGGPLVNALKAAEKPADKLKVAFEQIARMNKADPSGFTARMYSQSIGLGWEAAALSLEQFNRARAATPELTDKEIENAQKYKDTLVEMGKAWDKLVLSGSKPLFPAATAVMNELNRSMETNIKQMDAMDRTLTLAKQKWQAGDKGGAIWTALAGAPDPKFAHQSVDRGFTGWGNLITPREGPGLASQALTGGRFKSREKGQGGSVGGPATYVPGVGVVPTITWSEWAKEKFGGGSPNIPHMARGGIVSGATLAMVGEGGPEAIVPLNKLGGGSTDKADEVHTVKEGTLQALIDFKSYIDAGAGGGGGAPMGSLPGFSGGGGRTGGGQGNGRSPGVGGTPNSDGQPSGGGTPASLPPQEGDITGTGPSGGRFNQPAGTPEIGPQDRETVTLANGQKVTVNKKTAAQFQGFFNDLIKAGAPVRGLGGIGTRGNPSEHPGGFAVDWSQSRRDVVSPQVQQWISRNRGKLKEFETRWGMSGGENWRHPDTGHFSIDTLYGQKHLAQLRGQQQVADGSATPSNSINNADGTPAGGSNPIAAERARVMKQLQEPGMRDLTAQVIGHEQAGEAGRADVLESLVNRAVVTGKHPRDLIKSGFYGPYNRGAYAANAPAWALKDYDQASADVGAGRNQIGGRVDQGMLREVAPGGRQNVRGEYYGWMGLRGEKNTAAARALQAPTARIDGAVNAGATAASKVEGSVNVTVNSNGTAAKTSSETNGGLWQRTTIQNYKQMQQTEKPSIGWGPT